MLRRIAALVLLLPLGLALHAQSFPQAEPSDVGLSPQRLERLEAVMQDYVAQGKIAGVVTLVARHGQIAHLKGFGHLDVAASSPMPVDAIFRIASQSKAVTSVAVMMLYEEGKLLLSDPVSKFIPEFQNTSVSVPGTVGSSAVERFGTVPAQRKITIRDLLTHTAGISYGWGAAAEEEYKAARVHGWYFADHDETIGEAIQRLARLPFVAQPGEKWVYGFSTDVLGYLVERVSGKSLAEFFQTRIFEPLNMDDTHFYLPPAKLKRFTPVYAAEEDGGALKRVEDPGQSAYVQGPGKCYSGGAGLLSTALDYARFLQMLLNGGELDGARLLSPKTVELMTVDHVGDLYGEAGFGLGFWVVEDLGKHAKLGSVGSYGWGGAYYTTYWVDPAEELVAVFMAQLLPARGLDLQEKFRVLVYQAIVE